MVSQFQLYPCSMVIEAKKAEAERRENEEKAAEAAKHPPQEQRDAINEHVRPFLGKCALQPYPGPVQQVVATRNIDPTVATVTFQPPKISGTGQIKMYTLYVLDVSAKDASPVGNSVASTSTTIVVSNLDPGKAYQFSVTANNGNTATEGDSSLNNSESRRPTISNTILPVKVDV